MSFPFCSYAVLVVLSDDKNLLFFLRWEGVFLYVLGLSPFEMNTAKMEE